MTPITTTQDLRAFCARLADQWFGQIVPAIGGEDGAVEIVVQLAQHGHQPLGVDGLVFVGQGRAGAQFFEHVIHPGQGQFGMGGLLALENIEIDNELFKRGISFEIEGEEVDGMDVLAVRAAAQRAIERARAGEGPTLLECLTYRFRGHSLADPDELREAAEKEFWARRDPIKQLAHRLTDMGLATAEELKAIEKEIDAEVADCVEFALAAPEPDGSELTRYIWADD